MALENWPFKVTALVLALLLWFSVTSGERQETSVPTRVQVELQDEGWVILREPGPVRTIFQGSRGDVVALGFSGNDPVIRPVVDSVTGPVMELELSPEMVVYDRELSLNPIAIRPQRVQVRLDHRVERRVPVRPELDVSAAPEFSIVRPVLVQPDSVTVVGAESEVTSVDELVTEVLTLESLRRPVTRDLRVGLPDGLRNVEVRPRSVLATVEVDTLVERAVRRPLLIRGGAGGSVVLGTDSVTVTVRGPRTAVRGLAESGIVAYVEVGEVPAEPTARPVRLELPGEAQYTVSSEPAEVEVGPRATGPGAKASGPGATAALSPTAP